MTKSHAITLSGLQACTTYHYRVKNADSLGQETVSSDAVFTTSGCSATSAANSTSQAARTEVVTAPTCSDTIGTTAPELYGAVVQGTDSILLYFTKASNPVDRYALQFGTKSSEYEFGADSLAVSLGEQMSYVVKNLQPNTTYYFRIRGGNGCMPGSWSNEVSAKTEGKTSLDTLQFTKIKLETITQETSKNSAENQASSSVENRDSESSKDGYTVTVRVLDKNQQPVRNATVTIHSKVQTALTDAEGVVTFSNVEQGDHKLLISYGNFSGEQTLHLAGSKTEFKLEVQVTEKTSLPTNFTWIIVGSSCFSTAVTVLVYLRYKKQLTYPLWRNFI
jgi:hypothetical protein